MRLVAALPLAFVPLAVPLSGQPPQTAAAVQRDIRPGQPVEERLPVGAVHTYLLSLTIGQLVRIDVEETPRDFYLRVHDPSGRHVSDAALYCRQEGPCTLPLMAESPGDYRLELRSLAADFRQHRSKLSEIHYRLRVETAAPEEAARAHAQLVEAVAWVKRNAHPLQHVEAGNGFADLLPLRKMLAGVQVVGLGEATHGTREFFQVKHRLAKFLVREMGFSHFAMEIDQGAAEAINAFVLHGRGDRAEAVRSAGMWQWDTEEFAALLDWLREHNRHLPERRRVRFAGFDFQLNDRGAERVLAFLRKTDPERASATASLLLPLVRRPGPAGKPVIDFYSYTPERKGPLVAAVKELFRYVEANRTRVAGRVPAAEYEAVLQAARRLVQFVDTHSRPGYEQDKPDSGVATRDRYLAENVIRIVDDAGPRAKLMLWSHNEHVRRDPYNMGYYLGRHYRGRYYAFGLAFDRGGFRGLEIGGASPPPLRNFSLPPALQGSVGWYLRKAALGDSFVDFRRRPTRGLAAQWLSSPRPLRSIGNGYAPSNPTGYYRAPVMLGTSYDGIIFIEETTAARGAAP